MLLESAPISCHQYDHHFHMTLDVAEVLRIDTSKQTVAMLLVDLCSGHIVFGSVLCPCVATTPK